MSSTWADAIEPGPVDPEAFLYMGADPCWTPAREVKRPGCWDSDPDECSLCRGAGGVVTEDVDDDGGLVTLPPLIAPGSKRVCARCMRYGRERARADLAAPDPSVPVQREPGTVTRGGVTVPERFAKMLKG